MSELARVDPAVQDEKVVLASKVSDKEEDTSINTGTVDPLEGDDADVNVQNGYTGSTHQHPFTQPLEAEYWKNIYEEAKYEGRHRFDPSEQWSSSEEKKLVRKVSSALAVLNQY